MIQVSKLNSIFYLGDNFDGLKKSESLSILPKPIQVKFVVAEFQRQLKALTRANCIPLSKGILQRKCVCGGSPGLDGECEGCRGKLLQRRSANAAEPTTVPPIVHEVLRSPGQPLDAATRAFFEPRFGHDFSNVRVHTDAKAAESARAVNALAYTVGSEVVFGTGLYAPYATEGKELLAHELTHVIRQHNSIQSPETLTRYPQGTEGASETLKDYENNERYCKDTSIGGLLHKGVCFREVVVPCNRARHVCFEADVKSDEHYDEFSPVEKREPNGDCYYHAACAYSHIVTEVPAAIGWRYFRDIAKKLKEAI
jgi:hypothetical protein